MGAEELVVQLILMHAEFSRRLRANESEYHRLWENAEEAELEVGILGGKPGNVQHVHPGWHYQHGTPSHRGLGQGLTRGT